MLEFLGKGQQFASLTGEKLSEYQVTRALADVTQRLGVPLPVYTVAPVWDDERPYYGLFVERGAWDDSAARDDIAGVRRGALEGQRRVPRQALRAADWGQFGCFGCRREPGQNGTANGWHKPAGRRSSTSTRA